MIYKIQYLNDQGKLLHETTLIPKDQAEYFVRMDRVILEGAPNCLPEGTTRIRMVEVTTDEHPRT